MRCVFQTIERFEKMVEGGSYYEAQQMYKSTSARYSNLTEAGVAGSLRAFSLLSFKVSIILHILVFNRNQPLPFHVTLIRSTI